ncbi:carbonate dehydratase [Jiulongibacter sediminis]|uniref:Carbonic anhydrase n=1 Tax=Jiulongibacter sediminis TaxID=1605367 RepID=A0A0P7BRK5_9BACT|nr:carbonate dehydratase [Jiulongibacter sediminis]KPM49943.1 carbonate dehydratase [Jiulongibacter sediminis]TBX26978.1 carbonate dehydratase [Jiulongibacter sediminis]
MKKYDQLLESNKAWAKAQAEADPTFFEKMAAGQSPEFLWIGCADSRAPADKITQTDPGSIFVHRNVANLVVHTDMNMLAVLQYAVEHLHVKHIMVVGHYGCGGVKAAMSNAELGLINKWVRNIKDVYVDHKKELEAITNEDDRFDRLVELNVVQQVKNLAETSIVQKAWKKGDYPHLHGWVLELKTGTIKKIYEIEAGELDEIDPIYRFDI